MAEIIRSAVFAVKEETTEGVLVSPAGADFIPLREGFTFAGNVESVSSNELVNDIGQSKSFVSKETPSASIPI